MRELKNIVARILQIMRVKQIKKGMVTLVLIIYVLLMKADEIFKLHKTAEDESECR